MEITVIQFTGYSLPVHHLGMALLAGSKGQNITQLTKLYEEMKLKEPTKYDEKGRNVQIYT